MKTARAQAAVGDGLLALGNSPGTCKSLIVCTLLPVGTLDMAGRLEYSVGAVVCVLIVLASVFVLVVGANDGAVVGTTIGATTGIGGDEVPYSGTPGEAASIWRSELSMFSITGPTGSSASLLWLW